MLIFHCKFLLASWASRHKKPVTPREIQLPWRAGEWKHRTLHLRLNLKGVKILCLDIIGLLASYTTIQKDFSLECVLECVSWSIVRPVDWISNGLCVECRRSYNVLSLVNALWKALHSKIFSRQISLHAE